MEQSATHTGKAQYRLVRLAALTTDGRFNRPISSNWVETILSNFDMRAFGAIDLWEQDDGTLVILDGQHRVQSLRLAGVQEDAKVIPALVHKGLTLSEAARLFVQLNHEKLVNAYDRFKALREAGDLETGDVDRIVQNLGLTVAPATSDGCISCVEALYRCYRLGEPKGVVLSRALIALHSAWGDLSEAYRSALIRGLALYIHDHRDADPSAIGTALARGPGAPINLLAWAKTIAGTQRLPLDRAIADVIEARVMKRRHRPKAS